MRDTFFKKYLCGLMVVAFVSTGIVPPSHAQSVLNLPQPGTMVQLTPAFEPPVLKGVKVNPDNPFQFEFILDKGGSTATDIELKEESGRLIKYFLAALTVPEKDLWVNLSPYEQDRIITNEFGQTEMGRDLLSQDYILKQISASLMYPENDIGKEFWKDVYAKLYETYGTTDVPTDTFNKVWITPDKAVVYEDKGVAFIGESHLKVMLESDYLAAAKTDAVTSGGNDQTPSNMAKEIIRNVMLPVIEKEVNEGRNFAQLRQVYQSLILAAWYKRKIKDGLLSSLYVDQKKIKGVTIDDPKESVKIWEKYVEAFKKGAYNYIKEERDEYTQELIPRKYFSGGANFNAASMDRAIVTKPMRAFQRVGNFVKKAVLITVALTAFNVSIAKGAEKTGAVPQARTPDTVLVNEARPEQSLTLEQLQLKAGSAQEFLIKAIVPVREQEDILKAVHEQDALDIAFLPKKFERYIVSHYAETKIGDRTLYVVPVAGWQAYSLTNKEGVEFSSFSFGRQNEVLFTNAGDPQEDLSKVLEKAEEKNDAVSAPLGAALSARTERSNDILLSILMATPFFLFGFHTLNTYRKYGRFPERLIKKIGKRDLDSVKWLVKNYSKRWENFMSEQSKDDLMASVGRLALEGDTDAIGWLKKKAEGGFSKVPYGKEQGKALYDDQKKALGHLVKASLVNDLARQSLMDLVAEHRAIPWKTSDEINSIQYGERTMVPYILAEIVNDLRYEDKYKGRIIPLLKEAVNGILKDTGVTIKQADPLSPDDQKRLVDGLIDVSRSDAPRIAQDTEEIRGILEQVLKQGLLTQGAAFRRASQFLFYDWFQPQTFEPQVKAAMLALVPQLDMDEDVFAMAKGLFSSSIFWVAHILIAPVVKGESDALINVMKEFSDLLKKWKGAGFTLDEMIELVKMTGEDEFSDQFAFLANKPGALARVMFSVDAFIKKDKNPTGREARVDLVKGLFKEKFDEQILDHVFAYVNNSPDDLAVCRKIADLVYAGGMTGATLDHWRLLLGQDIGKVPVPAGVEKPFEEGDSYVKLFGFDISPELIALHRAMILRTDLSDPVFKDIGLDALGVTSTGKEGLLQVSRAVDGFKKALFEEIRMPDLKILKSSPLLTKLFAGIFYFYEGEWSYGSRGLDFVPYAEDVASLKERRPDLFVLPEGSKGFMGEFPVGLNAYVELTQDEMTKLDQYEPYIHAAAAWNEPKAALEGLIRRTQEALNKFENIKKQQLLERTKDQTIDKNKKEKILYNINDALKRVAAVREGLADVKDIFQLELLIIKNFDGKMNNEETRELEETMVIGMLANVFLNSEVMRKKGGEVLDKKGAHSVDFFLYLNDIKNEWLKEHIFNPAVRRDELPEGLDFDAVRKILLENDLAKKDPDLKNPDEILFVDSLKPGSDLKGLEILFGNDEAALLESLIKRAADKKAYGKNILKVFNISGLSPILERIKGVEGSAAVVKPYFSRDLLPLAATIGDACYSRKNLQELMTHPGLLGSITFFSDVAGEREIVGSALVLKNKVGGEDALILRAINPTEKFIGLYNSDDFLRGLTRSFKEWGAKAGIKKFYIAMVPGSTSNRGQINKTIIKFVQGEPQNLDIEEKFNGYDLREEGKGRIKEIINSADGIENVPSSVDPAEEADLADQAAAVDGGIDLNAVDGALQVNSAGQVIKFNIDPSMLKQYQEASGFVPVIIHMQPMNDLSAFLGVPASVN